jgi:hypothetical protein
MGFIKKYKQYKESVLLEELGFEKKSLYGSFEGVDYEILKRNKHGKVFFIQNEDTFTFPREIRGGVITMSTDVNAVFNSKSFSEKVKNWFKSFYQTMKNRLSKNKRISKYLKGLEVMRDKGFTIGKFMKGSYIDNDGRQWDEKSFNVVIHGVDNNTLNMIATGLADLFNQQAVLVHRYSDGETYILDAKEKDRKRAIRNDKIGDIID